MFFNKKDPLAEGADSRDLINSITLPLQGGFVIVGVNRDWDGKQGMDVGASLRKVRRSQVLFSVAKALNMTLTECVAALEMYSKSQVFQQSPLKKEDVKKEG